MEGSFLAISGDGHHKPRKQSVRMNNWDLPKKSIYISIIYELLQKGCEAAIPKCWNPSSPKAVILVYSTRTCADKKKCKYSSTV